MSPWYASNAQRQEVHARNTSHRREEDPNGHAQNLSEGTGERPMVAASHGLSRFPTVAAVQRHAAGRGSTC